MHKHLLLLLDDYIEALQASELASEGFTDRNWIFECLSAAGQMRRDILDADYGRAASIVNEEARRIGWDGFYGPGAERVHEAFQRFADALQSARLAERPDAGFGHQSGL